MTHKTPYFYPNVPFRIFLISSNVIYDYSIAKEFKLTICINNLYKKWNHKVNKQLNLFCLKTYTIYWIRVVFKGKGFRLRRFRNTSKVTFNFGHSHWTKLGFNSSQYWFKKLKRQNYLFFASNFFKLQALSYTLRFIKSLNVYTKRGLRLKKQYIKRRFGKISQVVSSLH